MPWRLTFSPHIIPLLLAAAISLGLARYAWRRRTTPGALAFAILLLGVAEWAAAYAAELAGADLATKLLWAKVKYLGIVTIPPTWAIFALQFTGHGRWLTRRTLALLAGIPALTLLLMATTERHGLIFSRIDLLAAGPFLALDVGYGRWFWVYVAHSYALLLMSAVLCARLYLRAPQIYRLQAAALLIGMALPTAGNIVRVFRLGPVPYLDLTPFAFTVTGALLVWALFGFRLLDIVPVARDAIVEGLGDGVIVLDARDRVVDLNPAAQRILGTTAVASVGRAATQVLPIEFALVERCRDGALPFAEVAIGAEAARRDYEFIVSPLHARPGPPTGWLVVLRDVTERKRAATRLRYLAHHDVLTGLPNRALFQERLAQALDHARRRGSAVALLFLDLDRFKVINDTLGHETGDRVLRAVAARLSAAIGPGETVARMGGDEFTIILPQIGRSGDAAAVARAVLAALAPAIPINGRDFFLTTSIGIALYPADGEDPDTLVKHADQAMYHAKERGKNRYHRYAADLDAAARELLALEHDLHLGLERGEFRLHYQPQFDLGSGAVVGLEALVRWQHPRLGLLPPARFIPLAEETGLIVPLGRWVLEESCRRARAWQARFPGAPLAIGVNLSARQLRHGALPEEIAQILGETGLAPGALSLEITEGAVLDDAGATLATLGALRRLGVRLALDDFGTGYSSLSHLKQLPIDTVKVDKAFVSGLGHDPRDAAILRAVVDLARTLGLAVTAEGVETAAQAGHLRALGCDLAQGHYFARPLPEEEAEALLADRRARVSEYAVSSARARG